jgi:hypothetical protein
MNDHDKNNLLFLLNSSRATVLEWTKTVTDDDMDYAMELLHTYRAELDAMEQALEADDMDMSESAVVLGKIMYG